MVKHDDRSILNRRDVLGSPLLHEIWGTLNIVDWRKRLIKAEADAHDFLSCVPVTWDVQVQSLDLQRVITEYRPSGI